LARFLTGAHLRMAHRSFRGNGAITQDKMMQAGGDLERQPDWRLILIPYSEIVQSVGEQLQMSDSRQEFGAQMPLPRRGSRARTGWRSVERNS
jgi:hypothetical protein